MTTFRNSMIAAACALVGIVALQLTHWGAYHNLRCGAQKWERPLLWMDFGEPDYDEYGIEERWLEAHRIPCAHIWLPGNLRSDSIEGWPTLSVFIAQGRPLADIRRLLVSTDRSQLNRTDKFGRTAMHWAAIYRGFYEVDTREALVAELSERGLSMDQRDGDGLTPRDWQSAYDSAAR